MNIFDLQATISLNAANFENGVQQAQTAFNGLGAKVDAGAVALGSVMASAVTTAASGLADFGKDAIQTGMNFDTAMSNVKAISGLDAYNRIVDHLRSRVDGRSQFPSAKGKNFKFRYLGMWK